MENLFKNTPIRTVRERSTGVQWMSAADVCAALLGCGYQNGRNYWKWLKHRLENKYRGQVTVTNRLRLEAADGRLRFTDVLDCAGVLRLIMLFPSPKADKYKLWIAKITASGKNVMKIISNAVNAAKDTVRSRVGNMFMTEEKMQFNIADEPDFFDIVDGGYCFFPVKKILRQ